MAKFVAEPDINSDHFEFVGRIADIFPTYVPSGQELKQRLTVYVDKDSKSSVPRFPIPGDFLISFRRIK